MATRWLSVGKYQQLFASNIIFAETGRQILNNTVVNVKTVGERREKADTGWEWPAVHVDTNNQHIARVIRPRRRASAHIT